MYLVKLIDPQWKLAAIRGTSIRIGSVRYYRNHEDAGIRDEDEGEGRISLQLQTIDADTFNRVMRHEPMRLCANIMTRNGLIAATVTGQTGDGGIDGEGMLAIDELSLIKAPVAWQCKRYKDKPVSPDTIRDFRGAIEGRARFGLIFTTSSFTSQAQNEARRAGATPIELVGLEDFLELMRKNEIGVMKSEDDPKVHQVDHKFFDEYLNPAGVAPGQLTLTQLE